MRFTLVTVAEVNKFDKVGCSSKINHLEASSKLALLSPDSYNIFIYWIKIDAEFIYQAQFLIYLFFNIFINKISLEYGIFNFLDF